MEVSMYPVPRAQAGFSLTELMLVVAFVGTIAAIAVPLTGDVTATIKLNDAARQDQRELAEARLRAVSSNRSLRVRTNCPSVGVVRTVEVVGIALIDDAANRCTHAAYPFPPDNNLMTRPNYDGPMRPLPDGTTVTTVNLQFQPDGTVLNVVANVATALAAEQTVTISRLGRSRTVRVNAAGKIQLQ
jgi:prepilin-type N-terminal cleavage/methylation domain-containing protein